MATELYRFIELYRGLRDSEATDGWGPELVLPWLEVHPELRLELQELGRPESHRVAVPRDPVYFTPLESSTHSAASSRSSYRHTSP